MNARLKLALSLAEAGKLIGSSHSAIYDYEQGEGTGSKARKSLLALSRAYQRLATERGYDPALFHESVLCPGEFPPPMAQSPAATPAQEAEGSHE